MADRCYIVPPHILRHTAQYGEHEHLRTKANRTLERDQALRLQRQRATGPDSKSLQKDAPAERFLHDAKHSFSENNLPGELVRKEGDGPVKDKAVNQAYDNVGTVLDFYKEHFNWNSFDNKNHDVTSTVHFGEEYENACQVWDPEKRQMVFGDGDEFLNNFTGCIDVIAHEITHAVTDNGSPLDYWGMPGALNEHISDVFGIMVKQKVQDEKASVADWLIGEDCILPDVKGTALRSMKAPGKAYDDPRFGKDPQVANMSEFKTMFEDNGGVHIYSGIPNKAFYLVSVAFGGYSWEKAGQIWWKALRSGRVTRKCTFKQFADITLDVSEEKFGKEAKAKVLKAWVDVGVLKGADQPKTPRDWCTFL